MYSNFNEPPRPVIWVTPEQSKDFESDSENENDESYKKRRKRQVLSCSECKRRKIKCDRNQPCGPCVKRGDNSKCEWSMAEKSANQEWISRTEFTRLEDKVGRLEAMLNQVSLADPQTPQGPGPKQPSPVNTAQYSLPSPRSPHLPSSPDGLNSKSARRSNDIRLPPLSDMVSFPSHRSSPQRVGMSSLPTSAHPQYSAPISSRQKGPPPNGHPSEVHFYAEMRHRDNRMNGHA